MAAEAYSYDSVGNLTGKTVNGMTKTIEYEFFAGYRIKKGTEPDGRTINYTYDNNDNLCNQTVSNGVTYSYDYDARNQVTGLTAVLDGRNFKFNYGYDVYGRMTSITYPNRINPVTYQYDELDRLQTIPGFVNSCSYDLDNQLLEMVYSNGIVNNYTYDVNNRPTNIRAGSLLNLNYTYDLNGNITQINDDYYGYDGLNRLTWYGNQPSASVAATTGMSWTYDGAGNMTGKENRVKGATQGVTSLTYDLANRLCSMGSTIYVNDAKGARIQKQESNNIWDYFYDGESRLTKVAKNALTQVENGKTTYYIYSGSNPLLEYSSDDVSYLYRIYAGKNAIAEEKDGVVKFYHKDHLGSTRVVTDAAGKKIAEYKFAPYGQKESASGADGTDYGFTDKTEDAATGLKYFGARFYDAEAGRFLSLDPAQDGDNWFAYCYDNPVNFIDPDGLRVDLGDPGTAGTSREFSGRFDRDGDFHSVHTPDGRRYDVHFDHDRDGRGRITTVERRRDGSSARTYSILDCRGRLSSEASYRYSSIGKYLGCETTVYHTTGDNKIYTTGFTYNAITSEKITFNNNPYEYTPDIQGCFVSNWGLTVETFNQVHLEGIWSRAFSAFADPISFGINVFLTAAPPVQ